MTRLTDAALAFDEPSWRLAQREAALSAFTVAGLPDPADEVWKHAPLASLKLDELELAAPGSGGARHTAIGGRTPSAVITVDSGVLVDAAVSGAAGGLTVSTSPDEAVYGSLVGPSDAFAALNLARTPGPIVIEVDDGAQIDGPVVLLVEGGPGASFPRVLVRVGRLGSLRVLEHLSGPEASLVASVAEYVVGESATLSVCTVQTHGMATWSIARTRASLARDATFSQTIAGLGSHYDRVRADARLDGDGSTSILETAHVGTGDQVHDLRTMQDHRGARTTSRLHSKAAVAGGSRSIYSGLIRMQHGARKADARQVNNSLVLSDAARADAVPNLDIEENDVKCAHASTVGPVDPEQRWYLESRGVSPEDAVQLMIEGFFSDVEHQLDDAVLGSFMRDAISRLDAEMPRRTSPEGGAT